MEGSQKMSREERRMYRQKIAIQHLCGIGALIACVVIVLVAMTGVHGYERDISPILPLSALGVFLLTTKKEVF